MTVAVGRFVVPWVAAGVAALAALASAAGTDAAPAVLQYGFCLAVDQDRCLEVVLPDSDVDFEQLPVAPDGGRYITFYSVQPRGAAGVIVHLLSGEDLESAVEYRVSGPAPQAAALRGELEEVVRRSGAGGAVVAAAFVLAPSSEPMRAFSRITVPGPGLYSGRLLDRAGHPLPGAGTVVIGVSRRPP